MGSQRLEVQVFPTICSAWCFQMVLLLVSFMCSVLVWVGVGNVHPETIGARENDLR